MNKKEIKVNAEEKAKFIEDLVFNGYTTAEHSLYDGKLKVIFKSLTVKQQLDLEKNLYSSKNMSAAAIMHTVSTSLLAQSIVQYGDKNLSDLSLEERISFISGLPSVVADKLIKFYNEFTLKLKAVIDGEVIDEVFFETESTSLD
jgi:hypothetical protein